MPMFVEAGKQDAIPQTSRVNLTGLTIAVSPSAGDITLHNGLWLYTRDPKTIPLRMDLSSLKALLEGAIAMLFLMGFPFILPKCQMMEGEGLVYMGWRRQQSAEIFLQ